MSSTSSTVSSRASSAPSNTQTPPVDAANGTCEAERFLMQQSNRLAVLFALCIGLEETTDDGSTSPFMDLNEPPFSLMKKKKDIKPSLDILREEVKRRSDLDNTKPNKPKPNGWNAKKCHDWLKANPITTNEDISFLLKRAKAVKLVVATATQRAPVASGNQPADIETKWIGPLPYLRLIHCLMEDDIKDKWIHRNDPRSILAIDARRSDVRAENAFEMIASRWNSEEYNPTTMVSSCHYDFAEEIDIGFDATKDFARATPTKVKDKLAKMKSDLTSIIQKWERSGQGDGGRIDEEDEENSDDNNNDNEDEFENAQENIEESGEEEEEVANNGRFDWGRSEGRQGAFDCRESFLGSNPSYLLYFWDVLDKHDLFNTTMNRLSNEVGASSGNEVPSVVFTNGKSTRSTETDEITVFVQSFKQVIVEASMDATKAAEKRHKEAQEAADNRVRMAQEAEDNRVRIKTTAANDRVILQANLDHKGYLKRRIDTLRDEARRIRFKLMESEGNESRKKTQEDFYQSELQTLEKEIVKLLLA